jgi:nitroreductase
LLILFTADVMAWRKEPERYWRNLPRKTTDHLVSWIGKFHAGREWLQRDEAQRSIGMAMQTLMLAAKALGYDSCPMVGFDLDGVAKLVRLPDDHVMGPMVAIGKRLQDPAPKPGQLSLDEIVVENTF